MTDYGTMLTKVWWLLIHRGAIFASSKGQL